MTTKRYIWKCAENTYGSLIIVKNQKYQSNMNSDNIKTIYKEEMTMINNDIINNNYLIDEKDYNIKQWKWNNNILNDNNR